MATKKIRMLESRRFTKYGIKDKGVVWVAPKPLADQLCRQKFAEEVGKPKSQEDNFSTTERKVLKET